MSHMVIYRTADGKAAFQQVDDLAAAVAFVEKVRNEDGVETSRIYRLEQVNFRFEPYYQVRLETGEPATGAAKSWDAASGVRTAGLSGAAAQVEAPVTPPAAHASAHAPAHAPASTATPAAAPATGATGESTVGETADEAETNNGVRRGLFGR